MAKVDYDKDPEKYKNMNFSKKKASKEQAAHAQVQRLEPRRYSRWQPAGAGRLWRIFLRSSRLR